jgi:hypothetical protein
MRLKTIHQCLFALPQQVQLHQLLRRDKIYHL